MSDSQNSQGGTRFAGLKAALVFLLLLGVLACAGFITYRFLRLSSVEVDGNSRVSDEDIITFSGLKSGDSLIELNSAALEALISGHPQLKSAKVTKKLPDKLVITVDERTAAAYTLQQSSYVVTDEQGVVLDISQSAPDGLLQLLGLAVSGYTVGDPIGLRDEVQFAVLLHMLRSLCSSPQRAWYRAVDLKNPVDVLLISRDGITVHIGLDDELDRKLTSAANALFELEKSSLTGGTLDVDLDGAALYSPQKTAKPVSADIPSADETAVPDDSVQPLPNDSAQSDNGD